MRREQFPSSRESVEHTINLAEAGQKLNKDQRKSLRDYLVGQASSNVLKPETAERVHKIREILGYPPVPNYDKDETKVEELLSLDERISGERDEKKEHSTRFSAIINGIQIIVNRAYSNTNEDYELYLPQVKIDYDSGISDQVMRLPGGDNEAKQVFEEACRLAKERQTLPKEDRTEHAVAIFKEMSEFVGKMYDFVEV